MRWPRPSSSASTRASAGMRQWESRPTSWRQSARPSAANVASPPPPILTSTNWSRIAISSSRERLRRIAAKKLALERGRAAALANVQGIVDRRRVAPAERMGDAAIRDLIRDVPSKSPRSLNA